MLGHRGTVGGEELNPIPCLGQIYLFQDPAFPADSSVLGDQEVVTYYFGGGPAREEIEWLRPAEICAGMGLEPAMVVGERDRFDVNQVNSHNFQFENVTSRRIS